MAERLTFNYGLAEVKRQQARLTPAMTTPESATSPTLAQSDWAYWGVFIFTALLFFRPQDTFPALGAFHLPEIAAAAALMAMFGHRLLHQITLVRITPEVTGVGALALVMLCTIPFSIWPRDAFETFTELYLKVVLVFVLMVNSIRAPRALKHFTWLILVASGYVGARGVLDYAQGENLIQGERLHGAISGLMGNPNDLATNMVTFLPLAVFIAVSPGRWLPRLSAGTIAALMLCTVVFTKSRSGLLGLFAAGLVIVVQVLRIRPGIGAAMVIGTLATIPVLPSGLWVRLNSIVDADLDETGSREARKTLMRQGWETFLERPLTGVGAGQFKTYNPPGREHPWRETHNVLLQIAAELGLFGLIAFLYLVAHCVGALIWLKRLFRAPPARARRLSSREANVSVYEVFQSEERDWMRMFVASMSAGFAGWLVCAQFASIGYYWTFYYLLALIAAARDVTAQRLAVARRSVRSSSDVAGQPAPIGRYIRTRALGTAQ